MRKLKLSLEALQVDSFHATDAGSARGTVPGHSFTQYADESCFQSCNGSCNTCNSCYGGCGGTGAGTCGATCGCPPGTGYTECGCQTWETCPNATVCA
jgi:hypothetical protein